MNDKVIKLISKDEIQEIILREDPAPKNVSVLDYDSYQTVYADREYVFVLTNVDNRELENISLFINGEKEEIVEDNGKYRFVDGVALNYFVFKEKIGLAEISIRLDYENGTSKFLYTGYLSVLVKRDRELDLIDKMTEYVYNKYDQLISVDESNVKTRNDEKSGRFINIEEKLSLAENILRTYKDEFGYFSANCRFKTETVHEVDDSKKLQTVTPQTLQFIATHPGYLTNGKGGIKIGNHNYIPEKTLIQKNRYSVDIYENQIVVGFLRKMIEDANALLSDIESMLTWQKSIYYSDNEYIHSSFLIFRRTEKTLTDCWKRAVLLKEEYKTIYNLYCSVLNVHEYNVLKAPKPTPIFRAVAQYNNIFNHICKWFEYVPYSLEREHFMMSFIDGAYLYEIYTLSKIIDALTAEGFVLKNQYKNSYTFRHFSKYADTLCDNTFEFEGRGGIKLTLYYQPVIYNNAYRPANGINLYRNTSISLEGLESYYYTPDFILKCESGGEDKYLIMDAKFSSRSSVRRNHVASLVFKYLFSIAPRDGEIIAGLCAIYGRSEESDAYESVYDYEIRGQKITPAFDLVPITAGVNNDKHTENILRFIRPIVRQ